METPGRGGRQHTVEIVTMLLTHRTYSLPFVNMSYVYNIYEIFNHVLQLHYLNSI